MVIIMVIIISWWIGEYLTILVDWRVFDNPTALVSYYYLAGAAFFCISYRGKLLNHKLNRLNGPKKKKPKNR
jgi:hypothetical protein